MRPSHRTRRATPSPRRRPQSEPHLEAARVLAGSGALAVLVLLAGCRAGATKGEILFADGLERLALGDSAGALELLEEANYELGDDPRVLFHIGRLSAARGTIEGRAHAHTVLQRAVQHAPGVGIYRAAYGALLQRQRFTRQSTNMLASAVRLDPSLGHAWLLLGQNMQEKFFDDLEEEAFLDSAMACYARAMQSDTEDHEARYRFAFLHMYGGHFGRARDLVTPIVSGRDCPGRFGLLLAAIEYHARRFDRVQQVADDAFHCMSWKERESWIGLRSLIHPDSVMGYRILSDVQRDSVCLHYWWGNDPTPTTFVNERLLEHLARVVDADFFFDVPLLGKRGRDTDRGEIYQRYGPPGRMKRMLDSRKPGWRWTYESKGPRDTHFRFVDRYLNGDFQLARRSAFSDFQTPLLFEVVPAATRLAFKGPGTDWQYALRFFRGQPGRTAVEIAFEVDSDTVMSHLALEAAGWGGPGRLAARQSAVAIRSELHALPGGRAVGRMRLEVPAQELVLGLQALAVQARDSVPAGDRGGAGDTQILWAVFGRDSLRVQDFHTGATALSDIMLAYEVRHGAGGLFDMGGVVAVPRVSNAIEGDRLHLYFEIYPSGALLAERGALAVSYRVVSLPPPETFWDRFKLGYLDRRDASRRPAVQATFTFLPGQEIEQQQLSIDLSAVDPGPYELTVELVDTLTGAASSRTVPFELVRPRQKGS
ncbi:MAG: GWxTD domain-containing protein [Candidatus Krumholzibacteriia bacterium]